MTETQKPYPLSKRSFASPPPDRRNSEGGVGGENSGAKNRMYRMPFVCAPLGNRSHKISLNLKNRLRLVARYVTMCRMKGKLTMNKPKTVAPRRLKRCGDYHVIQIRLDPLLWEMVKQTAHQRGVTSSRLLHQAVMFGLSDVRLSSNPERSNNE